MRLSLRLSARASAVAVLAAAVALLPTAAARAQETAGQTPADSTTTPQPIPTSDFAQQEDAVRVLVDSAQALVLPDPHVQEVADHLTALSEQLANAATDPEVQTPGRYPLRRIQNVRTQWSAYDGRIESWRRTLRNRLERLESVRRDLENARLRSAVTDSTIAARGGSDLIRRRIGALVEDIETAENQLDTTIEETLALQEQLLGEHQKVTDQIAVFDDQLRRIQRRLIETDSPPLWLLPFRGGLFSVSQTPGTGVDTAISAATDFARENRSRLLFQLAFVSFLAVALMVYRRRVAAAWGQMEGLRGPLHLLDHPVSTSVILGLLLSILLYPAPPLEIAELAFLVSVPAVVALLRGFVGDDLRPALYMTSALLVLDVVATSLDWLPGVERLLLLGEAVAAIAGLRWLLRPDSPARRVESSGWWRATLVAARAAQVVLIVGAVANIIGSHGLAEVLTAGVVRSAYLGVLFAAGALIGRGLVAIVPRTRLGMAFRGLRRHPDVVVARLQKPVDWAAFLMWLWLTAENFFIPHSVLTGTRDALDHVWRIGSIQLTLGGVVLFLLTVFLSFKISQGIRFILAEEVLDRLNLPRGVPTTISTLTHYTILLVGLLVALAVAGIDLSRVTLLAGALGVGIGFGLQGLVNNFVSGLILIFERPISVGDTVAMGTIAGRVQRIGMRSTTVLTFDGAEVIVPNGNLIANDVTNWTLTDQKRRVEVPVGAAYGTDPERVLDILRQVAEDHTEVLPYPEPQIIFQGFGESSLDFVLRAWVRSFEEHWRIRSELTTRVYAAFNEHGIQIPFPQRDLHLKTVPKGAELPGRDRSAAQRDEGADGKGAGDVDAPGPEADTVGTPSPSPEGARGD